MIFMKMKGVSWDQNMLLLFTGTHAYIEDLT